MRQFLAAVCGVGLGLASAAAQEVKVMNVKTYPTIGEVVRSSGGIDSLLAADAKIEVLWTGFDWSEGPVWMPDLNALLFCDIPRNSVMKWQDGVGVTLFLKPSGYTGVADYGREPGSNGLAIDKQGRLLSCEHGDRRVSRMEHQGGKQTLADSFEGKRLNSPNDLAVKSNGDIYFTDPPYGMPSRWEDPRRELDFCGVYRIGADGKLTLLTKEMTRPNGIAFSPDEKILYVANSDPQKAIWTAFPVKEDGTLGPGKLFKDVTDMVGKHKGLPDGLKVDKDGNLFATGPGGVHIYSPDGALLGRIDTYEATANCGWGGDGSILYLTSDMYLCRIQTKTKGANW